MSTFFCESYLNDVVHKLNLLGRKKSHTSSIKNFFIYILSINFITMIF